jgi:hypothetical protein
MHSKRGKQNVSRLVTFCDRERVQHSPLPFEAHSYFTLLEIYLPTKSVRAAQEVERIRDVGSASI